jgi:glycosyltransferase involved in cell wall biosynthesis
MNNPKVSIITPSYNQGKFIEQTILSVINQSYRNIEFIVIDACSTDETVEILKKYINHFSILKIEKDNGQADAINKGIKLATGDLITWINSDDILYKDSVEKVVSLFSKNPSIDFIYGDVDVVDFCSAKLKLLKGKQVQTPSVFYHLDLPIPQQGSIWKKEVNTEIGFLNEKWHYVLDREYFLRICLKCKVLYYPYTLGAFRQHFDSKSSSFKDRWINELPIMYKDLVSNSLWKSKNIFLKFIIISSAEIHCSYIAFNQKRILTGLKHLIKAISIFPIIIFLPHIYYKVVNKVLGLF